MASEYCHENGLDRLGVLIWIKEKWGRNIKGELLKVRKGTLCGHAWDQSNKLWLGSNVYVR